MAPFFLGILVVLGPSVAAVAWLIWHSGASEYSGRDADNKKSHGSALSG